MTGSVRARVNGQRHWRCSKYRPALNLGGVLHCPNCGRRIHERYKVQSGHFGATYIRTHVGLWGFWGAC